MKWINTTIGKYSPFVYGKGLPKVKRQKGDIPVYGSNGCIDFHSESYINSPGIIIGRKGSVGAIHLSNTPFWPIDTSFYITKDNKELLFTYYLLKSLGLENMNSDSAVPGLNRESVHSISIRIPESKQDRGAIGSWISKFDNKISLNIKTNETLEALAQALFKSWFVDFDPVKAKAKLKQEGGDLDSVAEELGMSKEILALFPDEFEESELGLIPKGWELKPLYETAEYINGSAFKAKDFSDNNEGLPIIKIAELKQGISAGTKFTLNEVKSKYFIDSGDVLYSWSGSPETSLEVFKWHGGKGWLNQHIFKLNFDSLQQRNFTYFLLKQIKPLLISTAKQKQTTGLGHITVADMKRIKITYPDNGVLKKFSEKINPLYDRSSKLIEEIGTLTKLRDTLLPKLLSGEITIESTAITSEECV